MVNNYYHPKELIGSIVSSKNWLNSFWTLAIRWWPNGQVCMKNSSLVLWGYRFWVHSWKMCWSLPNLTCKYSGLLGPNKIPGPPWCLVVPVLLRILPSCRFFSSCVVVVDTLCFAVHLSHNHELCTATNTSHKTVSLLLGYRRDCWLPRGKVLKP